MCLCFTKILNNIYNNQTESTENLNFLEKLDNWLFLKSRSTEKLNLPPPDEFVINPMRQSTEVIIGDYSIFY